MGEWFAIVMFVLFLGLILSGLSGRLLVRLHGRRLHLHRLRHRRVRGHPAPGPVEPLVRLRLRPEPAGHPLLRLHGGDLREIRSGGTAPDRHRPADGPDPGRTGAHRGRGRDDAGRRHRRGGRHGHHDGPDLAAVDGALRLRPPAGHRRHRRLGHPGPAHPAEPRAHRAGQPGQGLRRRALPGRHRPRAPAVRALRRLRRATWPSATRRRRPPCPSRSARPTGAGPSSKSR